MKDLVERDEVYDAIGFERCGKSCKDCPIKCTWYYTVKNMRGVSDSDTNTETISREDLINTICKSDKYTREGVEQVLNTDGVLAVIEAVVLDAVTSENRASYWHNMHRAYRNGYLGEEQE